MLVSSHSLNKTPSPQNAQGPWWRSARSNGTQSPEDSVIGWLVSRLLFVLTDGQHRALYLALPLRLHVRMSMGWFCYHRSRVDERGVFKCWAIYFFPLLCGHSQVFMNLCCFTPIITAVRKKPWSGPHSPGGIPKQVSVAIACGFLLPPCSPCPLSPPRTRVHTGHSPPKYITHN